MRSILLALFILAVSACSKEITDLNWNGYKIPANSRLGGASLWGEGEGEGEGEGDGVDDVAVRVPVKGLSQNEIFVTLRSLGKESISRAKKLSWEDYLSEGKPDFIELENGYFIFENRRESSSWAVYSLECSENTVTSLTPVAECSKISEEKQSCLFSSSFEEITFNFSLSGNDINFVKDAESQVVHLLKTWTN
ncbi:hypothetical protein KUV89_01065 [Marinobacter hydrocarbonoclasticus]|nr:hypothetical protein [Marinobacter nauticus]